MGCQRGLTGNPPMQPAWLLKLLKHSQQIQTSMHSISVPLLLVQGKTRLLRKYAEFKAVFLDCFMEIYLILPGQAI